MAEEFNRCKCGDGWYRQEKQILIEKGSTSNSPIHYKEKLVYICTGCNSIGYVTNKEPE
jgi:uncharacterized metal-binding protein